MYTIKKEFSKESKSVRRESNESGKEELYSDEAELKELYSDKFLLGKFSDVHPSFSVERESVLVAQNCEKTFVALSRAEVDFIFMGLKSICAVRQPIFLPP